MASYFSVEAITLVEYNHNNLEKNYEGENEAIYFTEQKANLKNNEMLLTLNDRMYIEKTRKTLLKLALLRTCKSKLMKKFS